MRANEFITEEKTRLDPKCWTGKKIGNPKTKMKGGVRVNNCVPAESVEETQLATMRDYYAGNKDAKDKTKLSQMRDYFNKVDSAKSPLGNTAAKAGKPYIVIKKKHYDMAEGWKTGAALGGIAGGIAGGPIGAGIGAGAGAIAGHLMKGKDPKTIPGYSENLTDATSYVLDHLPKTKYGELIMSARPQEMGISNHKFDAVIENDLIPEFFIKKYGEEKGTYYLDKYPKLAKALYWEIQNRIRYIIPITITSKEFRDHKLKLVKTELGDDPKYLKYFGISQYDDWESKPGVAEELSEEFDLIENIIDNLADQNGVDADMIWEDLESLTDDELYVFAVTSQLNEDWQKANKRDKTDGMSQKAVNAYRRENPGSKLKTAVTTKPSKLKKGGKASKRRKSYCSRSRGQMKMHSISCAKTPDKAICKARRRWNC
jgi:hypothetical protein